MKPGTGNQRRPVGTSTAQVRLVPLAFVALAAVLLALTGCDKESRLTGPSISTPGSFPTSPDQLLASFQNAYGDRDSTAFAAVLHPDFRFLFSTDDTGNWPDTFPTDHLVQAEELQVALNMFSGQPIGQWDGTISAAISAIDFHVLQPVEGDWSDADPGSGFPGSRRRPYSVGLTITRPGNEDLSIQGQQEFFVASRDSVLPDGSTRTFCQLVGQRDLTTVTKAANSATWGQFKRSYLTTDAPVAVLVYEPAGDPAGTIRFDASGSYDPDSGLHAEPFRWQFGSDAEFTAWSADPVALFDPEQAGELNVRLQVRDRWNRTDLASEMVAVDFIFPDTEDKLMANFRQSYGNLDPEGYAQLLHANFTFIFQGFDVERFDLPSDRFSRTEEIIVAEDMFTGGVIASISFDAWDPLEDWTDSWHPDFPDTRRRLFWVTLSVERPGLTTLLVEGLEEFFVASRDSTLSGGEVRPYFELVGQADQTNGKKQTGAKAIEEITWGGLKVVYGE